MAEKPPFTVASFYKFISEMQLMATKCSECGTVFLPPKPLCTNCFSKKLEWIELEGVGKLVSYSVIYVAPVQFQSLAPYSVGIVELESGLRLPGMIHGLDFNKIKVGMNLKIDYDTSVSSEWPAWCRYFFKPM
jgi:uncharacterized OB-fold protein